MPTSTIPTTGGECSATDGWQSVADDGLDDTTAIVTSFQWAAFEGDALTNLDSDIV